MHNIIVILFVIGSTLLQAREKFVSAKKGTRTDAELEEVIVNSLSTKQAFGYTF